jgi:cell division protease FtsH
MYLPERDKYSQSLVELDAIIAGLFGGRIAEELIFGHEKVTTGAADDIRRATELARRMVTEFGFSDALGPLRYSDNEEEVFLGHSVTQRKNVSEATARVIDQETRKIVERGEVTARKVITENLEQLHVIAEGLLEYETLSRQDIDALLAGKPVDRTSEEEIPPEPGPRASVPTSGRASDKEWPGGLEPEPQPGN